MSKDGADDRFSGIYNDVRFAKMPTKKRKVEVDERFGGAPACPRVAAPHSPPRMIFN
jgi:hypothetical protein